MNQIPAPHAPSAMQPVLARLRRLGPCSADLAAEVLAFRGRTETIEAKAMIFAAGFRADKPRYLLTGWACRVRQFPDGRRQILDIVLPGDGIYLRQQSSFETGVLALTACKVVDATSLPLTAYDFDGVPISRAQANDDEERSLRQITRLGRMSASERIADIFVELHERLQTIGHTEGDRFRFPLSQEVLADTSGLSVVHVNRVIKELRLKGVISAGHGWAQLGANALGDSDDEPGTAARHRQAS